MPTPRNTLARIIPYTPGKAIPEVKEELGLTDVIKMASNENPMGASVSLQQLQSTYDSVHIYPHQPGSSLLQKLSQKWDVSPSRIILGNGSDEVIMFLALAYLNPGDEVLSSTCTFSEYRFVSFLSDGQYTQVPVLPDFRHDLNGILKAITPKTKLIFIANPNNPTGTVLTHQELETFLSQVPSSVIVALDEAYAEFADQHFPDTKTLLKTYKNLVALRTFSKLYGLAGLRIGYGVASDTIAETVLKTRLPFNINSLALEAAALALDSHDFVEKTLHNNKQGLEFLTTELTKLGCRVLPSQANFVCTLLPEPFKAKEIFDALLKKGLIIRALNSFGLDNAVRITVGLPEHNQALILALKEFLT